MWRKILKLHFSQDKEIRDDLKFSRTIKNLWNVIKLWGMWKLTLERKITIFKAVHLPIITQIPDTVIEELKQIQKNFCGITIK